MKTVDTLIVGFGLAGMAFTETLSRHKKSFHIIDAPQGGSSLVAAGIYNPTVLKRCTMTWMGEAFHQFALPFYKEIEDRIGSPLLHPAPIKKLFASPADHNRWVVASDQPGLSVFLNPTIQQTPLLGINTPFGYGEVAHCGRLDINTLFQSQSKAMADCFTKEDFDFSALKLLKDGVSYKKIIAKNIVFCEGYKMKQNPYFEKLPLQGSKGQMLEISSSMLSSESIIKGPIFIAPLGKNRFWAGASFENQDKSLALTQEGREWLEDKIRKMISVEFTVENHLTQIRPTVQDRRPLLGTHPIYSQLYVLNGMGSRGVLTAPLASKWLYEAIYENQSLPAEVDIKRFEKLM